MDYPNDADGDALHRVAERSDMSKPMDIDSAVDVPSKKDGEEVQRLAVQQGFARVKRRNGAHPVGAAKHFLALSLQPFAIAPESNRAAQLVRRRQRPIFSS